MKKYDLISSWKKKNRPLVLDGANGGILQEKIKQKKLLWSSWLNIEDPEAVIALHKDYINSGAEILTTNTFRTNPHYYNKYKLKYSLREFVTAGVNLAKIARGNKEILIAGSNAPAEDCYQPKRTLSFKELEFNHLSHINLLLESGVDFILNETQSHFDELQIICRHCAQNNIPFVVSLYLNDDLRLLSGESVPEIIDFLMKFTPSAVSFNCIQPGMYKGLISQLPDELKTGFYFNCGDPLYTSEQIECHISPEEYVKVTQEYITGNTVFVGSCCGSNPNHTHKIRSFLDEKN